MKKNYLHVLSGFIVLTLLISSCENSLDITLPQGPQGEQGEKGDKGDKGDTGLSAFELWLQVNEKDPSTPIEEFFNSLRGNDGQDGLVPVIGENGNWFIGDEDTGIPARGANGANGVTPVIGENGNWFIGGEDTGVPARGADGQNGVDGKSAYELWKEAVDDGEMTNKDGSEYTGGNTWEDFLIWLQGGDVSVLHRYWITLPGNEGKTIEEFIDELFDCHCDGITVSLSYEDECMAQNTDGTLRETYNAQLRVGGPGGTQVEVTGEGISLSATIVDDTTPVQFVIPRGEEAIPLTITCTRSSGTVVKQAVVPALQLVKLAEVPTSVQVAGEEADVVTLTFESAPVEMLVNDTVVYDASGIVEGSGWAVSNEGKTFTRTYQRGTLEQKPTVRAFNSNGVCTTIEEAFIVPPLTPVEVGDLTLTIVDDCFLSLSFTGTPGMSVRAMNAADHTMYVDLTEVSPGTYITSEIPRRYEAFTVLVRAQMEGRGTVERTIEVRGSNLSPVAEPLTITVPPGAEEGLDRSLVKRRLTNHTNAPLTVTVTRSSNTATGASSHPSSLPYPRTTVIPANGYIDAEFYRDYTSTLAEGRYVLTFKTLTECGLEKVYTMPVQNQGDYRYCFVLQDGWGDGTGNPNDLITIQLSIFDGIPGSYVEFQVFDGSSYTGVSRIQLDAQGNRTWTLTSTRAQVQTAVDNVKGFFYFFSDRNYMNKYNIGADKEEVVFAWD